MGTILDIFIALRPNYWKKKFIYDGIYFYIVVSFRLYETQVKKIVKVQSMLRAFLAKRSVQHKKGFKLEPSNTEIGNLTIPKE